MRAVGFDVFHDLLDNLVEESEELRVHHTHFVAHENHNTRKPIHEYMTNVGDVTNSFENESVLWRSDRVLRCDEIYTCVTNI